MGNKGPGLAMKIQAMRNKLNPFTFPCARQSVPGQTKTPGFHPAFNSFLPSVDRWDQALMAFTRAARRDTFREAVFLCITPFWAPRIISGWAA